MAEIVRQGAVIVGGCCGTTPEYIRKTVGEGDVKFSFAFLLGQF